VKHALLGAALLAPQIALASEYTDSLAQVGVTPELHERVTGAGVRIANIDGYPDLSHPDLYTNTLVVNIYGAAKYPERWSTNHATHVVSIMNGIRNGTGIAGVAPGAYVIDFPVWGANDKSVYGWPSNLKAAYDLAYAYGAKVLNRELNYARLVGGVARWDYVFAPQELPLIASYRAKFVFVQPAGNQGLTMMRPEIADAETRLSHVLVVGSVGADNVISPFSNRPGHGWKNLFVVAPGEVILAADMNGGVSRWSGTSFAAPHVAGAAALLFADALAKRVTLTPSDVAAILKVTARDLGAPGVDSTYGYGIVDAAAALGPVGLTSYPIVPGQIVYDRFQRPFALDPIAAPLAPDLASWAVMMGGERVTGLDYGRLRLSTRIALDDRAALTMVGLERAIGDLDFGLSIGTLHETASLLGNVFGSPSMTRLVGVDIGWRSLSAFYMRGDARGYEAESFGFGVSLGRVRLDVVKPLSVTAAGEMPWALLLKRRVTF